MTGYTSVYDPEGIIDAELPLDRRMHTQLAGAVLAWTAADPLAPADYDQVALLLSGAARAVADDVRRFADRLPEDDQRRVLAEVVLAEADRRLSQKSRGTLHCVQHRARLVRGLYERLDRLKGAVPAP